MTAVRVTVCDCIGRPGFSDGTVPFHRDDCPRREEALIARWRAEAEQLAREKTQADRG